jgi:uncharacterized protein (TIGR03435 family)
MMIRFIVLLLTVGVAGLFAQPGFFGPIGTRLKAGDLAPDVVFTRMMNAAGSTPEGPLTFAGQFTVLAFFPDTSHNPQPVSMWNALVAKFAGKPLQFVWITGEAESSVAPWLAEHPLMGRVLLDASGATARAYGLELPAVVFIGADGRIVGFDRAMVPTAELIGTVLEGRTTTTPLKPGAAEFKAFVKGRKVLLDAEPPRMPQPDDHKPDFPPSYLVHIEPSQTEGGGNFGGMDFWSLKGFDLKSAMSELYNRNTIRIDLPHSLDNRKRYDFSMVLPAPESKEKIYERFRQGIQEHFHSSVTSEIRSMDVYVVTATDRKPPAMKAEPADDEGGSFTSTSVLFGILRVAGTPGDDDATPTAVSISAIRGISVTGSVDEFCQTLERQVDRPIVNETNLEGEFVFEVEASHSRLENDFLDRLRDELGLVIVPARRSVEILVFKSR